MPSEIIPQLGLRYRVVVVLVAVGLSDMLTRGHSFYIVWTLERLHLHLTIKTVRRGPIRTATEETYLDVDAPARSLIVLEAGDICPLRCRCPGTFFIKKEYSVNIRGTI